MRIIDKFPTAKYIAFPDGKKYKNTNDREWIFMPVSNDKYFGFPKNNHHFTTAYHRQHVLPTLEKLFSFGYNENDFVLKKNIIQSDQQDYDLSYLIPKHDKSFKVTSLRFNIEKYQCNFSGLMKNEHTDSLTWFTPYHDLFCLPHSCSLVENISDNNNRDLLIIGDSQMIPSLAVLCYYYKSVTYIDNRNNYPILNKLKDTYDDVLCEIFAKSIDYYDNFLQ